MAMPSRGHAAQHSDELFDVLVAGSGAGGMVAALTCHDLGLKVLLVEKAEVIGGTTAFSGGGIWIPLSRQAKAAGAADSEAEVVDYLLSVAGDHGDEAVIRSYARNAAKALAYLEDHSDVRYSVAQNVPDYYPQYPGAKQGGRSLEPIPYNGTRLDENFETLRRPLETLTVLDGMMIAHQDLGRFRTYHRSLASFARVSGLAARHFWDLLVHGRSTRLTNGNALAGALYRSLLDRGVDIRTRAALASLELDPSGETRAGVEIDGQRHSFRLRKGVVLACGGFPWDEARKAKLYPHAQIGIAHRSLAPVSNGGDGIRIGQSAGGVFRSVAQPAAWVPASEPVRGGRRVGFPHWSDLQKAGFILVNRAGRRFTNESQSYQHVTPDIIAMLRESGDSEVYLICDNRALRREGMGVIPPGPVPLGPYRRSGYLRSAPTVEKLAEILGVDAAPLKATVARFNEAATTGADPDFGRGEDFYQRAHGTPGHLPNPCLGRLDNPPFHAVCLRPSDMGTFAGLKTDGFAQVVDAGGRPVPGLFAVGNDMASPFGGAYPGGGATLGPAITFGYLAAHRLAGRL